MNEQKKAKPLCPLIGQDGNIFNLLGIASKTLNRNGMRDEAQEMRERVLGCHSYEEALGVLCDYVEPVSEDEMQDGNLKMEGM